MSGSDKPKLSTRLRQIVELYRSVDLVLKIAADGKDSQRLSDAIIELARARLALTESLPRNG